MNLAQRIGSRNWKVMSDHPLDISIPLDFIGEQPAFFGAPAATASVLQVEGFVGDTQQGSSCNVEQYHLVPHCNGTHTETLGHIVDDPVAVTDTCKQLLLPATLLSVAPVLTNTSNESSDPTPPEDSEMITAHAIEHALTHWNESEFKKALLIRTTPNTKEKQSRHYRFAAPPPFFSREAMEMIVSLGVEHLLVDVPSLDHMQSDKLLAHCTFWQLPLASRKASEAQRPHCTVTEMVYIDDAIADGYYCLNLQLPPFMTDAAPSRPLLFPLNALD